MTPTVLLITYAVGVVSFAVGAIALGQRSVPTVRPSTSRRLVLAVIAGLGWPILAVGLAQFLIIAKLIDLVRASARRKSERSAQAGDRSATGAVPSVAPGCRRLFDDAGNVESRRNLWAPIENEEPLSRAN